MTYIDAYAIPVGEKGHIEGFPENTYEVDLQGNLLDETLTKLSLYFAELREVRHTHGQAIAPLSDMIPYLDAEAGVKRREGAGVIVRLC